MNSFFLICALALPPAAFGPNGQMPESREAFFREYKWIHDLLERTYPGHEFLIIPIRENYQTPPGWDEIPFQWRNHRLYKKPKAAPFAGVIQGAA